MFVYPLTRWVAQPGLVETERRSRATREKRAKLLSSAHAVPHPPDFRPGCGEQKSLTLVASHRCDPSWIRILSRQLAGT